jgi:hypothetical protein
MGFVDYQKRIVDVMMHRRKGKNLIEGLLFVYRIGDNNWTLKPPHRFIKSFNG